MVHSIVVVHESCLYANGRDAANKFIVSDCDFGLDTETATT